ncbi:MAG: hypothetical protein V4732_02640 [Pseudomonadota bacterium]
MFTKQELMETISSIDKKELDLAKREFNLHGFITDAEFCFSRVIYNQVGDFLLKFLSENGFSGTLNYAGCYVAGVGNVYGIFDERLYTYLEVLHKLKNKYYDV